MRAATYVIFTFCLFACASPPSQVPGIEYWDCKDWYGESVRRVPIEAFAPPEFICGERICYGLGPGRTQAGQCFFACPESRLPEFCEAYK